MNKKAALLFTVLVGAAIVLLVVSREIDSGSPDHDAKALERSQLGAEDGDAIVTPADAEVTAEEKQGRFANIAEKEAIEHPHPLAAAQAELEMHINDSLEGVLYVNAILDRLLECAKLPVSESVDFEYEDDDSVAYKVLGLPDGTVAHFLVVLRPIERSGRDYQQFQFEIQMNTTRDSEFYRDSWREGPRVHVALDQDENGNPTVLALLTERKIDLHDSRHRGVDAYQGRFTSGASFRVDTSDPHAYRAETFGIVNGHYASPKDFVAVPLIGDLVIDPQKVFALSQLLQQHYRNVRKQNK